ncbi:hypothetical protein D3C75_1312850 [compost metagenome]
MSSESSGICLLCYIPVSVVAVRYGGQQRIGFLYCFSIQVHIHGDGITIGIRNSSHIAAFVIAI